MQSNLVFANNAISSWFFLFFLIIILHILILEIITQIFSPIVELITHLEILINEAKAEIKIHTVTVETKLRKCSM